MEYQIVDSIHTFKKDGVWFDIIPTRGEYETPKYEYETRSVYSALIPGIGQDSLVMIRITDPNWDTSEAPIYTYKTFDPYNVNLIVGGDIGNTKTSVKMNKNVARKLNTDAILIGGDIAYDNNVPE